jgi:hypothetical protein
MTRIFRRIVLPMLIVCCAVPALAQNENAPENKAPDGFQVEKIAPDVTVISDGANRWGGEDKDFSQLSNASQWVGKRIDIPEAALQGVKYVRLRVFGGLEDYSYALLPAGQAANGLNEAFEVFVYGQGSRPVWDIAAFAAPADPQAPRVMVWQDFFIPLSHLSAGANTFILHKMRSEENYFDDYLFIGIDNSKSAGHSRLSANFGQDWNNVLNVEGSTGEYMMKLLLISSEPMTTDVWNRGDKPDAHGAITNWKIDGKTLKFALDVSRLDRLLNLSPMGITLDYEGKTPPVVRLFDENDKLVEVTPKEEGKSDKGGRLNFRLPVSRARLARIEIDAPDDRADAVKRVAFNYFRAIPGDELLKD